MSLDCEGTQLVLAVQTLKSQASFALGCATRQQTVCVTAAATLERTRTVEKRTPKLYALRTEPTTCEGCVDSGLAQVV